MEEVKCIFHWHFLNIQDDSRNQYALKAISHRNRTKSDWFLIVKLISIAIKLK